MTTVEAMKQLLCYIRNDGSTYEDISETNATDIWVLIGEAFNARFNNGSESGGTVGTTEELGALVIASSPGETVGTTSLIVSNASTSSAAFKYKIDGNVSAYGENLSSWETWTGQEITVEDGAHICVAEVDATGRALKAGLVTASINLG